MRFKILLSVAVIASITLIGGATSQATWSKNLRAGQSTTIAKGETHDGSLYAAGENVTIDGTVNGDVYCAGNSITITGTVNGDVLCAGQSIDISGKVSQDVRLAAQNIVISSDVVGSASLFAQNIRLENESTIGGDVNGASQSVTLNGTIAKNAVIATQALRLNGKISGNADVTLESFSSGSDGKIGGDFHYTADKSLDISSSIVTGQLDYNMRDHSSDNRMMALPIFLFILLALFASAMVVALIAPGFLQRADRLARQQKLRTSLAGFAIVFATPIIVVLLILSVIFVPLGFALLFAWLLTVSLSGIVFAYIVGSKLLASSQNVLMRMAGGALVVVVLYAIPIVGLITVLVALVVGSGSIISTLVHNHQKPRYTIQHSTAATKPARKK